MRDGFRMPMRALDFDIFTDWRHCVRYSVTLFPGTVC